MITLQLWQHLQHGSSSKTLSIPTNILLVLFNSFKSFLITKQHLLNSLFPIFTISQQYLGFHFNLRKHYVLSLYLINECTKALWHIKKLPLSLTGCMTVLSSYIKPWLLYKLEITSFKGMFSYLFVKQWFLSTLREFILGSMLSSIFSDKKLAHPSFHFCLWLFSLSLNFYQLSIFLCTT